MYEINWNIFKAKFNEREQKAFERLCYILFCREFNQPVGIFRYFNQPGIETNPIEVDGEQIGFQAKFYETKIKENKEDIKDSITKAKNKNPDLDKIYFYTNQEFSPSSSPDKNDPLYKTEIEDFAKSKGVEILWKGPSHLEIQLSHDENQSLAQHFFSFEKGTLDFISELNSHTLAILKPIHSEIEFNKTKIKIDRADTLNNLKTTLEKSPLVILSGEGGVGKTALVKDFYYSIEEETPFFIFKGNEFNVSHINDLFGNYGNFTLNDFIKEFIDSQKKYVVIDSAEKLSDSNNQEVFQEFLSTLLEHNWKIIFTTRLNYLDDLKFQFVEIYRLKFHLFNIEKIGSSELQNLSIKYDFTLPKDERFLELLRNPFYLAEYLHTGADRTANFSDFKNLLWRKQIIKSSYQKDKIHLKREKCFLSIAKRRADTGKFFVNVDECENAAMQALEDDEIIKYDSGTDGYFITHDIYEEWALDKIIERNFNNSENYDSFFNSIGSSLPVRRAFRNWLSEKLYISRNSVRPLIENSFVNNEIEDFWKDEILVSVLLSDYSESFFQMFEKVLLENNQKNLIRIIFLLKIACKEIDEDLLKHLTAVKQDEFVFESVYRKPRGMGWNSTIDFIYRHRDDLGLSAINLILSLLADWNTVVKTGITTRQAGLLALHYFDETSKDEFRYRYEDVNKQSVKIILDGSAEIKNELREIFNGVIAERDTSHRNKYYVLTQAAISSALESLEVAKNLPEQVINLADLFWFRQPEADEYYSGVSKYFCIAQRYETEYFPSSALQTPVYSLLRFSPSKTIDFILSFTNKTVDCYVNSGLKNEVQEIEVFINGHESVKQYASSRIWNIYRGTQVSSYLLASVHMALEKWLLEIAEFAPAINLKIGVYTLLKTQNPPLSQLL